MCDRIAILNNGNLVALDTTQKLLDKIETKKITFKFENLPDQIKTELNGGQYIFENNGSLTVNYDKNSDKLSELLNFFKSKNLKILDISTDDGNLEDVFVKLTKN